MSAKTVSTFEISQFSGNHCRNEDVRLVDLQGADIPENIKTALGFVLDQTMPLDHFAWLLFYTPHLAPYDRLTVEKNMWQRFEEGWLELCETESDEEDARYFDDGEQDFSDTGCYRLVK